MGYQRMMGVHLRLLRNVRKTIWLLLLLLALGGCLKGGGRERESTRQPRIPPEELFKEHFQKAYERYTKEDLAGAVEEYSQALSYRSDCSACYYNRGLALLRLKRTRDARLDFHRALATGYAEPWWARYYTGIAYEQEREFNRAALEFISATIENPDFWNAFVTPIFMNVKENDFNDCIGGYSRVLRMTDRSRHTGELHRLLGICNLETGDANTAIRECEEAMRLGDSPFPALGCTARSRKAKGDYDGAIADYSRALSLLPDSKSILYERGIVYLLKGKRTDGCADIVRAASSGMRPAIDSFYRECDRTMETRKEYAK